MFTPSGHKSIVNSVLFHPSLLHIVTAGIERHVILHSPTKSSPCAKNLELTPASVRALPEGTREDRARFFRAISLGLGTNEMEEDAETIALFDEYVFFFFSKLLSRTGYVVPGELICGLL
jgi:WD repeat-containing protein 22